MKDFLGILVAKLKAIVKPSLWTFVPTIVGQIKVAIQAKDVAKIAEIADRLEATAVQEREHADALDALSSHLKQMIADGQVDGIEAAEALELAQTAIDEAEDIVTGHDEDDAPTT